MWPPLHMRSVVARYMVMQRTPVQYHNKCNTSQSFGCSCVSLLSTELHRAVIWIPRKTDGDPWLRPGSCLGYHLHHVNLRCFSTKGTLFFCSARQTRNWFMCVAATCLLVSVLQLSSLCYPSSLIHLLNLFPCVLASGLETNSAEACVPLTLPT